MHFQLMDHNERNTAFSSKDIDFTRSWSFNSEQTFQLSSFSKCIRLASKYVTSPENQPRSQPSTSSLRLFLALRLPPTSTFLAKHRCNLTQPSRNTLTLPPFESSPSSRDFRFSFSFPSLPFSFQAFTKAWPRLDKGGGIRRFCRPKREWLMKSVCHCFFSLVQPFYQFVTLYARIRNFHNNLIIIHYIFANICCKMKFLWIYE